MLALAGEMTPNIWTFFGCLKTTMNDCALDCYNYEKPVTFLGWKIFVISQYTHSFETLALRGPCLGLISARNRSYCVD